MISNNAYDNCCFRGDYANAPLIWAARPYYALYGAADKLTAHINFDPGHNYGQENREAFYRFVRDNFYGGDDAAFSRRRFRRRPTSTRRSSCELNSLPTTWTSTNLL